MANEPSAMLALLISSAQLKINVLYYFKDFLNAYFLIPSSRLLQRYYEASLIYREVLQLESSSVEATQELKRAQTLHLMVGEVYIHSSLHGIK